MSDHGQLQRRGDVSNKILLANEKRTDPERHTELRNHDLYRKIILKLM